MRERPDRRISINSNTDKATKIRKRYGEKGNENAVLEAEIKTISRLIFWELLPNIGKTLDPNPIHHSSRFSSDEN